MLAETLLSDGEHRIMWGAVNLPDWQFWLFPIAVALGCLVCLATFLVVDRRRWSAAQIAALSFLLLGVFLFSSRLQVSEHHLIAMIPLAAVVVVLAFAVVKEKFRWGWILAATMATVYAGSAFYWQFAVMQGLKKTGGIGVWSDAVLDVAQQLDQQYAGRYIMILDWGLQENLYVLTDGRLNAHEIMWDPQTNPNGGPPRPWMDMIREGGVFLVHGPEAREYPAASEGFLRTLDSARPVIKRYTATQRNGSTYAQIIEVESNSIRGSAPSQDALGATISMVDPGAESLLTGFHEIEEGSFRWAQPKFAVLLNVPDPGGGLVAVSMEVFVPENSIRTLGALTLSGRVGDHPLAPMTFTTPGAHAYTAAMPAAWITPGPNRFEFSVDKHLGPTPGDARELAIVVTKITVEAK